MFEKLGNAFSKAAKCFSTFDTAKEKPH